MSNRLKKKSALLVIAIALCALVAGALLVTKQERLTFASYDNEYSQLADELPELLEDATNEAEQNTETFDAAYQSRAESIAFMAQNQAGYEATDAKMSELQQLLEVDNLLVVKKDGTIVAQAQDTKADFSHARFNQLKTVFSTGKASEAVEVNLPDKDWHARYYAAKIDEATMVVVEQDPESLDTLNDETGSVASVLKNVSVGQNGFVFAVSAKTHLITYHPNEELIGTDALEDGLDAADLEDGGRFQATLSGQELYCGVSKVDDTYYVFANPVSDMAGARNITVGVILFAFVAVLATVALYDIFVMHADEQLDHTDESFRTIGRMRYNRTIGQKASILSIVGFALLLAVTFYMQTLFALSTQSVQNNQRAEELSASIARSNERKDDLEEQYSERYLTNCRIAAYVVDANSELVTKSKLHELADTLQIAAIYVLDGDGSMIASSTPLKSYRLSDDPEDSSYEFRELLGGKEELVQALSTNDSTGEAQQFIGVATHDEEGYANGIVQIAVRPKRLENMIRSVKIDRVLHSVKVGASGYAFAVSKADGTIAYHPNEKLIGKTATEVGLTEAQLDDGFADYITINGKKLYASCVETDDYNLFAASPESELMAERVPLTVTTGIIAAICFIVMFPLLTLESVAAAQKRDAEHDGPAENTATEDAEGGPRVIDVTLADGRVKKSESAVGRWLNTSFSWNQKTPEQKLGSVVRWIAGIAVFVVFLAVLFKDSLFWEGSVLAYILGGTWKSGLNIFAVTASIMYACVAVTLASIAQWILRRLACALGARGETVCRLLSSLVKYGTLIFMLYWCLGVLGVDTATLLASAGIITLAVSFGAKDLVTDVLCGLFIIFEGEFRVGDVISVGGATGTVMEIGVRTTKVNDGGGNVMLLRNSSISNVTNKTKLNSNASVDIILPIGESLPYVENVLKEELPHVRERVASIIDGPFYKGVVDLSDSAMTIRIVATCKEKDRGALVRSLQREMKLLLSRHDVAPYQLVYDHKATDADKPTRGEMRSADEFNADQEEAARDLGNEAVTE